MNESVQTFEKLKKWFHSKGKKCFMLGGLAGSGKTTLIKMVKQELNINSLEIAYAAYTGKAVDVMKKKGMSAATTIHSLIYEPELNKEGMLIGFKRVGIDNKIKLIVIDEASMVDEKIHNDLVKENVKILYVGDYGQLPPVKSEFNLMKEEILSHKLTKIHRQAKDSGIVELASNARNGKFIRNGKYGKCRDAVVIDKVKLSTLTRADQIICGKNETRNFLNEVYRDEMGFGESVEAGEKIIIKQNNKHYGIYNGQQFIVLNKYMGKTVNSKKKGPLFGKKEEKIIVTELYNFYNKNMKIGLRYSDYKKSLIKAFPYRFPGSTLNPAYAQVDYGYAITCHNAQGSEWDKVLVFDESSVFGRNKKKWLYTAITRASKKLIIVKKVDIYE